MQASTVGILCGYQLLPRNVLKWVLDLKISALL